MPFFVKHLREDTKAMVLDANPSVLEPHMRKRKDQDNITLNVNLIGEEVLGEAESKYRIQKYEEALKSSYITYISIKITTIFHKLILLTLNTPRMKWLKDLIIFML